jgi:multicomponent Na+:H+ antiporter subunit E
MNIFALNIALAIAWAALTGNITLSGFWWASRWAPPAFTDAAAVPGFRALLQARLALVQALRPVPLRADRQLGAGRLGRADPQHKARPGIIAMPLDAKGEMEVLLVTNLISLTPGTLSLDVTDDCNTLLIHAMFADDPDAIRMQMKTGMERWVIEAME